jgi:hypothetical protein
VKPGALWPLALAGVLGLTVVANGVLLYTARSDAVAIEPDYYRKALAWDSAMAQARRNVGLGWRVEGRLEPDGRLRLRLSDRHSGLGGAAVAIEGFALAHAARRYRAVLRPTAEGGYEGTLARPAPGLHQVEVRVERGGAHFTAVLRGEPGTEVIPWN